MSHLAVRPRSRRFGIAHSLVRNTAKPYLCFLNAFKKLFTSFELAIARILDLDPVARWFVGDFVGWVFPLADNAFQIHRDDLIEQQSSVTVDVIQVENS